MSTAESCFHSLQNAKYLLRLLVIGGLASLILAVVYRVANA